MKFRLGTRPLALLALASFLVSFFATELWRDSHNSLLSYPEWRSTKAELAMGVMGSVAFLHDPASLAGRALNLAAWHGHQELTLEREWEELPELSLKAKGVGSSALYLMARQMKTGKSFAWRLSNQVQHPSAWIELGPKGEFLQKRVFKLPVSMGQWFEIAWKKTEEGLSLFAEGKKVDSVAWPAGPWKFALRGSSGGGQMQVKNLKLGLGGSFYQQDFSGLFSLPLFGALLFLSFAFLLASVHWSKRPVWLGFLAPIAALLILLSYRQWLAPRYSLRLEMPGYKSRIETEEEVLARLNAIPLDPRPVVLWLGGSQAWGAGASRLENTAMELLQKNLSPGLRARYQLVNGAFSGARVINQKNALHAILGRRRVAAVVLISGVNDAENSAYAQDLGAFSALVKQGGAKLFLAAEPMESPVSEPVRQRQQELLEFAQRQGLASFNLQMALAVSEDEGLLWWDFVHLTDFGALRVEAAFRPVLEKFLFGLPR